MIATASERSIMIVPASLESLAKAALTIREPRPGSANTVSITATPPKAEAIDWATSDESKGNAGRKALLMARDRRFIPRDKAKSEYWLSRPSDKALRNTRR